MALFLLVINLSRPLAALFMALFFLALILALLALPLATVGYLVQRARGGPTRLFKLASIGAVAVVLVSSVGVAASLGPATNLSEEEEAERREERAAEREREDRERTERAQANAERRAQEEQEEQEEQPEPEDEQPEEQENQQQENQQQERQQLKPEEEPEREQRTATPTNAYVADLLAIAERYGLECQRSEISDELQDVLAGEQEERNCEGEDASGMMYTMAMWSLVDTGEVDSIALTLTDADGRGFEHIAIEFFGDVAETAAGDPDFARTWIAENIYDVDMEETETGGVHYVLRGWPEIDGYTATIAGRWISKRPL